MSITIPDERLDEYRTIWERKPVLRAIYHHYYGRITAATKPGRTLEIGGGSGNLKAYVPDVVSTDILPGRWLDAMADAQHLPFQDDTFENIVFVDVLHHIERPADFFSEAVRVLRDGGRIVMVEPAITPISYVFYKLLHPEPVRMHVDPLEPLPTRSAPKDPFDSNQAVPTLIFGRRRRQFERRFPGFEVTSVERLSFFAYPLSGGFKNWCALPSGVVVRLLALEDRLERVLGRVLGFRLLVTITYRMPA